MLSYLAISGRTVRYRYGELPVEWQEAFHEYQRVLARRFAVVSALMGLIIFPFFQVVELWPQLGLLGHWWSHLGWRMLPVVTAIGILILRWRVPDGVWPRGMLVLYALSGMIMMSGMVAEHMTEPGGPHDFLSKGLVVVIALVAVLATAGARDLILVYGVPLVLMSVVVIQASVPLIGVFLLLVHPLIMMVIGLVISEVLYRVRLEAFMARQQLEQSASTDVLTGLANRRAFDARLEAEHARCLRQGASYALIMADLDHFKHVNDTHGHDVGDEVLTELARRLQGALRTEDELGRWGGEEFMVLLRDGGQHEAEPVAEKLRLAVADTPFHTSAGPLSITTSLGIAVFNGEEMPSMVARRADLALYAAKENGRNRCESA
ncbi:GGDEF domain-containing protein [Halovibrio salipaludis]|uniref:diguanylate cyclase n=1 Tax=Halovibrio salipaludis TaxID=2032626 RepID=A0A2A2F6S9_9GAMM|nr:sensor domain-containing diguanylate cyclase [Halovibrio salipaludis]PAU80434.1 GGDEF domain-containing protein [Halovibrio salipaludis]